MRQFLNPPLRSKSWEFGLIEVIIFCILGHSGVLVTDILKDGRARTSFNIRTTMSCWSDWMWIWNGKRELGGDSD